MTGKKAPEAFFFPISVDLSGKNVLIVGGGHQAYLEALKLLEFGAHVDVVASHMVAEFAHIVETHGNRINLKKHRIGEPEIEAIKANNYLLVYALSFADAENREALAAAKAGRTLVYSADYLDSSTFVQPTTLKRGHLKISVSTDGWAPSMEKALAQRIEASISSDLDKYVLFLSSLQERLKEARAHESHDDITHANKVTRELASSDDVLLALKRLSFDEALKLSEQILNSYKAVAVSSNGEGKDK